MNLEATQLRVEYSFSPGVKDVQQRLSDLVGIVSNQLGNSAQDVPKAKNYCAGAFLGIFLVRSGYELVVSSTRL